LDVTQDDCGWIDIRSSNIAMRENKRPDRRAAQTPRTPRRPERRTPLVLKESTSIAAAEYDWTRKILRVRFKAGRAAHRGGTYDYFGVPKAVVRDFVSAPSLGQFVNWKIKPYYKFKRVG
jgi:hypothetical protein